MLGSTKDSSLDEKFLQLFVEVNTWIKNGSLNMISQELYHELVLMYFVDTDNADGFRRILSLIDDDHSQKTQESTVFVDIIQSGQYSNSKESTFPDYNNPILMRACARNNFKIVQMLVLAGYR